MDEHAEDIRSTLADLSHRTVAELRALEDPVLATCMRRVLEDVDRSTDAVAGFQSSI